MGTLGNFTLMERYFEPRTTCQQHPETKLIQGMRTRSLYGPHRVFWTLQHFHMETYTAGKGYQCQMMALKSQVFSLDTIKSVCKWTWGKTTLCTSILLLRVTVTSERAVKQPFQLRASYTKSSSRTPWKDWACRTLSYTNFSSWTSTTISF